MVEPLTPDEFEDLADEWQQTGGWRPERSLADTLIATLHAANSACAKFADAYVTADARAEQAEAEVRALTARLDTVRTTVNDFAGAGSRVTYSGMEVAMVFESLLDRAAAAEPTPQTDGDT